MKTTLQVCLALAGLAAGTTARADEVIIVDTVAELQAAMVPANAGRTIHVVAGDYPLTQALLVPDDATLEGEGVLAIAPGGLPDEDGFSAGLTLIRATIAVAGDVVTLGDGSRIRGLQIEDVARPFPGGNVVMIGSRTPGDVVSAEIVECVLKSPNPSGIAPNGPNGRGLTVLSRNLRIPDLPPHVGSTVAVKLSRSIIDTRGSAIFAINFAAESTVTVDAERSIIGSDLDTNGGVSRPDLVHDSVTTIRSRGNWYRGSGGGAAMSLTGGSGPPTTIFGVVGSTVRNTLRVHSVDDRMTDFAVAVVASATKRFFGSADQGPAEDNRLELTLIGTTMSSIYYDLDIAAAGVFVPDEIAGTNNTVRLLIRGASGSGQPNWYGVAYGPPFFLELPPELWGAGNRVEVVGSSSAFGAANPGVDPPPAAFFTSGN